MFMREVGRQKPTQNYLVAEQIANMSGILILSLMLFLGQKTQEPIETGLAV